MGSSYSSSNCYLIDGYGAYRQRERRQRCLAHLIRKAIRIAESINPRTARIKVTPENLEEFRALGFRKADLDKLNDPAISKAEKNALYARRDVNYKKLYQAYGQDGVKQLTQLLSAKGLRQIYGATGVEGLKKVEQIIKLKLITEVLTK